MDQACEQQVVQALSDGRPDQQVRHQELRDRPPPLRQTRLGVQGQDRASARQTLPRGLVLQVVRSLRSQAPGRGHQEIRPGFSEVRKSEQYSYLPCEQRERGLGEP